MLRIATATAVLASVWTASTAMAATSVCRIPPVDFCQGCVRAITVDVARGGTCRVSFDLRTDATGTRAATPPPSEIVVRVNVAGTPARRVTRAPARVAARIDGGPRANCFTFNGRRFCE